MSTAAITNIDGRKWMHTEETELGDVSRSREVDGDFNNCDESFGCVFQVSKIGIPKVGVPEGVGGVPFKTSKIDPKT